VRAARIRYPDGRVSWTLLDNRDEVVAPARAWLIHLEQIRMSPNTIERFAKHVAALGAFLSARDRGFEQITVRDYDEFLAWCEVRRTGAIVSPKVVQLRASRAGSSRMSASLRNQIHIAVKSFYRNLVNDERFEVDVRQKLRVYDAEHTYKPFLEHISRRRATRRKDAYNRGRVDAAQRAISTKRLKPEQVLGLIESCRLLRDTFLVVLLYNTGLRLGEALGLRHADIDVSERVIWVVPRVDNENGARAKAGRVRAVPVHEYVVRMYEDLMTSGEYASAFESGTEYVFCNIERGRIGRAMTISRAKKLQVHLVARSGIQFHWHMLRHSHASEAIAAGYGLLEVADRLGHASPQTTVEFYRHLFSAEVRKLYLTGPERVQKRLAELRDAHVLNRDFRWS
jgi:integrase/recombinase XerD